MHLKLLKHRITLSSDIQQQHPVEESNLFGLSNRKRSATLQHHRVSSSRRVRYVQLKIKQKKTNLKKKLIYSFKMESDSCFLQMYTVQIQETRWWWRD